MRVIEIPTPRWTAFDAKHYDIDMPKGTAMEFHERAFTSPISYTPRAVPEKLPDEHRTA